MIKVIFLNLIVEGIGFEEACRFCGIVESTGYFLWDKMHFSKPYPVDYRKPKDAEAILDNQLQLTFSLLKEKGIKEEDIAIGFIDETSPQNTANTV